jgi:predicted Zn-ribbon and HTH transcriptional regulator
MSIKDALFGPMCARCGDRRTRSKLDDIPTCPICETTVIQAKLDAEDRRPCPIDATLMQKEVVHKLVIDRCPKCRGVWLDPQELDAIKKTVTQEGYSNGVLLGMAVG